MSIKTAVVAVVACMVAAASVASLVVSLKPSSKPQQVQSPPRLAAPIPGPTLGDVAQGFVPTSLPPDLAYLQGRRWVGAGGQLGPWWQFDPITQKLVKQFNPVSKPVPTSQIFPGSWPANSMTWYFPDPNPSGPVYYTWGSPDTN